MGKKSKKKNKKKYVHERKPKVHCKNCPAWVNVDDTEFINIEEDFQGADLMTFECPHCNTKQKSRIFG